MIIVGELFYCYIVGLLNCFLLSALSALVVSSWNLVFGTLST